MLFEVGRTLNKEVRCWNFVFHFKKSIVLVIIIKKITIKNIL